MSKAIVDRLRNVADQLESGKMSYLSGEIAFQSHLTGELSINSDLVLSSRTQPEVGKATNADNVYAVLYKLDVKDSESLNFDLDEREEAQEWFEVASDCSRYPLMMRNCRFHTQLSRGTTGTVIKVTRTK